MIQAKSESPVPARRAGRLFEGPGLFDMSDRAKLRFAGPQALWFLDQLVSNKVDELPPGAGAEALLLTPNGRITSNIRILHRPGSGDGPDVLVDAPAGHAQQLLDFFGMRVFATKVAIFDVSKEFSLLRLMGEAGDATGDILGISALASQEHGSVPCSIDGSEGLAVSVLLPAPGLDLWIPAGVRDGAIERLSQAGARILSGEAYESLRIAAGVGLFGVDFGETYLPQEAALERTVHFSKGCYLGQEAVAMAQRGRIKRRLRHLEFEGSGGPGKIDYKDAEAGRVTSAAEVDGAWFGIGTVRTDVPVGEKVKVRLDAQEGQSSAEGAGAQATVKELPGTIYGPRVPSARELREKLQGS